MSNYAASFFKRFFQFTAWTMETPRPYGAFHLCLTAAGVTAAFFAAKKESRSGHCPQTTLFFCGLLLAVSEIYKQGFLYYIVNNSHYDWWYFPFQLCSVPMYLCLLLPLADRLPAKSVSRVFCTFIQDFGLLGGIMALAEPSGLMHPYWTLTLHGFLWHFVLIFTGLYCAMKSTGRKGISGFLGTLPLFLLCCAIATGVNVLSHPYGNADMFYISPYYPNSQVIFHEIALTVGVTAGNVLYLLSVIAGGAAVHAANTFLFSAASADRRKSPPPPDF